jgi:hypothetical protein
MIDERVWLKRHRAAALHNLAERAVGNPERQRLGVRQPYAALTFFAHSSFRF